MVLSVGTLQAALPPLHFVTFLYAAYVFWRALLNPSKAPAVSVGESY
jgi:TRAP-type mannitol/chloroaromatic compound transport system permease large subunit